MQDEMLTETLFLIDEETHLPQGWRWVRIGELCNLVNGNAYKPSDWSSTGIPIIRIQNLNNTSKPFNYWSGSLHNKVKVKQGDVLLAWSGTPGTSFGVHLWKGGDSVLNQHIFRVDFIGNEISPEWFVYAANQRLNILINQAHGAVGLRHVNKREVEALEIPLPPTIEEQRRIASVLDEQMKSVGQARLAVEEQLKAANLLPNAFLRVVFESEEAQNWQKRKLGDYAKVQSGYAFKTDWYVKDGIRLLRNANVFQGFIDWSDAVKLGNESRPKFSSYELNEGDIVLSLDRPLVSNGLKVAKLQADDVPSLLLQRVGRFLLNNEIDSNYLYTFLNSENFINAIKGHDQSLGVPHISPSQVENIEIPIPPTIEEQRKLTKRINEQMQAAETLKKSLTEKLEAVKKLPATLLRKAFAGEI